MMRREGFLRYILALLGFVILFMLLRSMNPSDILRSAARMDLSLFALALAFTCLNLLIKGYRWQLMVYRMGGVRISLLHASGAVMAGVAAASLSPGRAVDIAKPLMLKVRYGVRLAKSGAATLVERLLDLLVVAVICVFFFPLLPGDARSLGRLGLFAWALAAISIIGIGLGLLYSERLTRLLEWLLARISPGSNRGSRGESGGRLASILAGVRESLASFGPGGGGIGLALLSLVAAMLEVFRGYFIFRGLGLPVSVSCVGFAFPASVLLGLLALIPGGIGVTETSEAGIVGMVLTGEASGAAYSLTIKGAVILDRLLSYYILVLIGSVILIVYQRALPYSPGERREGRV